ncbi:M14 family zinc carboxypeptidase [Serinibacter salmoneus]|uniref:Zinc carboxypeptidase n=1 Tax=Serinibacter salmoneus TaxID=556530 RepID=A0A2A9CYC9_9MICO|nr:M14 family zinc carboxypeptidase [Serinibacter salmoneus]PFG18682.1 zinc carboxypeptidase [Serinibacter salmoneus]
MTPHRRVIAASAAVGALVVSPLLVAPAAVALETTDAYAVVTPVSDQVTPPASYPYQPELRVFEEDPTDASLDRGAVPYDAIAPKLTELMTLTDRISTQVVGQSELGKDIYLVTVTAPETEAETAQQAAWREKIKHDAAAAAVDEELKAGYKVPLWFNANIHGNEWDGTDAVLEYLEYLATAPEDEVADVLANNRALRTSGGGQGVSPPAARSMRRR